MKIVLIASLLLAIGSMASAELTLIGPGVPVGLIATKVPFKIEYTHNSTYKFIFSGIEAKGNTAGAPGSSGTNGNGGQFHLTATVQGGGISTREGKLEFRDVQDLNTAPLRQNFIIPPDIIRATTTPLVVNIEWKGNGNAKKPDGYFAVLGEYQAVPPPPVGTLTFAVGDYLLTDAGSQPTGVAVITRE